MGKSKFDFRQNDNNLAIAYYRFSSHSQNETSIEQQQEQAKIYAEKHGLQIVKEYADKAMTGTNDNRPQYQLMLSEINSIKPAALIIWKTDRLGRDRFNLAIAKKQIRDAGCQIHYVAEVIPENGAESSFVEAIIEAQAEFYSKQLSQNVKRGMLHSANNALYCGVKVLGYVPDESKHYIIDEATAPIVRRIFDDYANGKPLAEIRDKLNNQGLTSALGKAFTLNSLRWILKNRSYIGEYHYSDVTIPNGMPALVSEELFDKVQERFSLNSHKAKTPSDGEAPRYWLTGKLFCGECGSSMHGTAGTSKHGRRYYYYNCPNHYKNGHRCRLKPLPKDKLEALVVWVLDGFLRNDENLASLAVDTADYYEKYYADDSYINTLQERLKETETALKNLVKAIEMGIFSKTTQERLQELEEQKQAVTEAIEAERVKRLAMRDDHSVKHFFELYRQADFKDPVTRDYILDYFVKKIVVYSDKLVICCQYDNMGEVSVELDEITEAVDRVLDEVDLGDHVEAA